MLLEMGVFDEGQASRLLIAVCKNQRYELAHALVKQGASMPLFRSRDRPSIDINPTNIQILLAAGIDINQVNDAKSSPREQLDEASVGLLLAAGANAGQVDAHNQSALL